MNKVKIYFLFLCLSPYYLFGGITGKLSGKITDAESKEPLLGVNVTIEGTKMGTTSGLDGDYYILQILPGVYNVKISTIGFKTVIYKNIVIKSDQTYTLNVSLSMEAVLGETVNITAARPLVETNITSTTRTLTKEDISALPNIKRIDDILVLQPGMVSFSPVKKDLHLRGGRSGEILYIVDGIPIKNIFGDQTSTLDISNDIIQEVQILSGGFNAEFGNAESGVVNIITRDGTESYSGSINFKSDDYGIMNFYNDQYLSLSLSGPEPVTQKLLPLINLNLPGKLSAFFSFDAEQSNTAYQYQSSPLSNFKKRKIELLGGLLNFNYRDKQYNSYTSNYKLRYDYQNIFVNVGYRTSGDRNYFYSHLWSKRMDSNQVDNTFSSHFTFRFNHTIDENTFYTIDIGRLERYLHQDVAGLTPPEYNSLSYNLDLNGDGFYDISNSSFWRDITTKVYTIKADLNSQISTANFVKMGLEWNYEEINSTDIQYPNYYPERVSTDRGLFPGYGDYRFILNNYPNNGSVYIQDKIEYEGIVANIGFRYDFFSPGKQVQDADFIKAYKAATVILNSNGDTVFTPVKFRGQFSPRLGISHPVTDNTVAFFNYGHFYQLPDRVLFFRDPFTGTGWVGNPNLKSPKTVSYEFGFDHAFLKDFSVGLKGFYKDYYDYIGQVKVGSPGKEIYMFTNLDYASSKGIEITCKKRYEDYFSFDFNYTYLISKGRSENPYAGFYAELNSGVGLLPREVRMPWDQEHTINFNLNYFVPGNAGYKLFGLPFINNWGITLFWNYGSGFPYTPSGRNSPYLRYSKTSPYISIINLKIEKRFELFSNIDFEVYSNVENLLNRKNIVMSPVYINAATGSANVYGDVTDANKIIQYRLTDSRLDPQRFYPFRQISIGFKCIFK